MHAHKQTNKHTHTRTHTRTHTDFLRFVGLDPQDSPVVYQANAFDYLRGDWVPLGLKSDKISKKNTFSEARNRLSLSLPLSLSSSSYFPSFSKQKSPHKWYSQLELSIRKLTVALAKRLGVPPSRACTTRLYEPTLSRSRSALVEIIPVLGSTVKTSESKWKHSSY